MGIGSLMLERAKETAIRLCIKNGFIKRNGVYDEVIDDDLIFHEYGFEVAL